MNKEEHKKYVDATCKSIKNKLGENTEEFDFFLVLIKTFNQVCNEENNLKQALDEIEKYINEFPCIKYSSIEKIENKRLSGKLIPVDDLLQIIKKAKGE